jgi:hypothetical protein
MVCPYVGKQPTDIHHPIDTRRSRILPMFTTDNHHLRGYHIAHFDKSSCQVGQHFQGHVITSFCQRQRRFGRVIFEITLLATCHCCQIHSSRGRVLPPYIIYGDPKISLHTYQIGEMALPCML